MSWTPAKRDLRVAKPDLGFEKTFFGTGNTVASFQNLDSNMVALFQNGREPPNFSKAPTRNKAITAGRYHK